LTELAFLSFYDKIIKTDYSVSYSWWIICIKHFLSYFRSFFKDYFSI